MHLRYRSVLSLVAICTALAVAPAFAAKPAPVGMAKPSSTVSHVPTINPNAAPPICTLGIVGPPANAFAYVLPPDDEYFTLLDPSNCGACAGGYKADLVHLQLYFTEPCSIPVTISLVPAYNNGGCFTPNPFDPPICGPVQVVLDDAGFTNQCVDYGITMPANCCFSGPVFLKVVFDQGSCQAGRPAFCGPAGPCVNCQQWNYYPATSAPGDELCSALGGSGYTGFIMNADISCCPVVPTLPGSWGKVKTIYR